jgi:hypothetical protein
MSLAAKGLSVVKFKSRGLNEKHAACVETAGRRTFRMHTDF